MKVLKFTLLGIAFSSVMIAEVNAQQRGNGAVRAEQRSENSRANQPQINSNRTNQPRIETRNNSNTRPDASVNARNRDVVKYESIQNNRPQPSKSNTRVDRKEPIKINNSGSKNYSYSKPIKNFNHKDYYTYQYNNINFYGNNGIYFRNFNSNFVRFTPPVGFKINVLPAGFTMFNLGKKSYYFYEGVYYEPYRSQFRVVEPPIGAIVYGLPSGYERIEYNGDLFYEFAGVIYDKFYRNGQIAYQVVGYLS